jgi:hypothetical protein
MGITGVNQRVSLMRATRVNLVKQSYMPRYCGGTMSVKRLLGMIVVVVLLACSAWAQRNDVSVTAGNTFVSTQTVLNSGLSFNPSLHFGNEVTVAGNYSRLIKTASIFGIHIELPVALYPRMDLNTAYHGIPTDIGALFITPSVRVNMFSDDSVSPWVSVGGGYGRFREAPRDNFYGPNLGPTGSNMGVVQFGAGLDVWIWHRWGLRGEARDFFSGEPVLNVDTNHSRMHNYYVGAGIVHRF